MRELRTIRIFLSVIFLAATLTYLFISRGANPMAEISLKAQIIPSALAATAGISIFWLIVTFVIGRVYCSSVCPVGALQDSATWLRRKLGCRFEARAFSADASPATRSLARRFSGFSFRPRNPIRLYVIAAYAICLPIGLIWISTLIEPWQIFRQAARLTNPELHICNDLCFAGNAIAGGILGLMTLLIIWIWALFHGRRFCSHICPIGTFLEAVAEHSVYQIRIDPNLCTNCMECERACKSEAIKVSQRQVDNGRCVRCFDCLKVCPNGAIRLQNRRNRPADPLLMKN